MTKIHIKRIILLMLVVGQALYCNSQKLKSEWLFSYYMPYDNNLSRYGNEIIDMIKDSIKNQNVIAVVQADFNNSSGMIRYIIRKNSIKKIPVENEYSAFSKSYEDYLKWVNNNFDFKKSAIVFLDHGGKLDELCLDETPVHSFLKVDSLNQIFKKVNGNKKIDLLFLQVCTKGSIEPLYEFKDVARYTLCSQTELGAPNYYYPKLFADISKQKNIETLDVLSDIIAYDRHDMYSSYTCIDNSKMDSFYILLNEFIKVIKKQPALEMVAEPKKVSYYGETYWDLTSFLKNISLKDETLQDLRTSLIKFLNNKLIIFNKLNPARSTMDGYCGLSIYALVNEAQYYNLKLYSIVKEIPKVIFQNKEN
jgi:Clostripain family